MKKLNNIELPQAEGRGRVFPYNPNGPHFAGPVMINGEIKVIKLWENRTFDDRPYFRVLIESVEESQFEITD